MTKNSESAIDSNCNNGSRAAFLCAEFLPGLWAASTWPMNDDQHFGKYIINYQFPSVRIRAYQQDNIDNKRIAIGSEIPGSAEQPK